MTIELRRDYSYCLVVPTSIPDGGIAFLAPSLFIVSALLGVLVTFFFPLDEGGEVITIRGKLHVFLVVIMGILTIGAMVAFWLQLQTIPAWSTFATYSLISAIVSLVLVILSGALAKSKYLGLIERLMVTPYQLYYFILSLMIFLLN